MQDRTQKKVRKPSGSGSSLESSDEAVQVPKVDDVLAEVDAAIQKADQLLKKGHWELCCGGRVWVED